MNRLSLYLQNIYTFIFLFQTSPDLKVEEEAEVVSDNCC